MGWFGKLRRRARFAAESSHAESEGTDTRHPSVPLGVSDLLDAASGLCYEVSLLPNEPSTIALFLPDCFAVARISEPEGSSGDWSIDAHWLPIPASNQDALLAQLAMWTLATGKAAPQSSTLINAQGIHLTSTFPPEQTEMAQAELASTFISKVHAYVAHERTSATMEWLEQHVTQFTMNVAEGLVTDTGARLEGMWCGCPYRLHVVAGGESILQVGSPGTDSVSEPPHWVGFTDSSVLLDQRSLRWDDIVVAFYNAARNLRPHVVLYRFRVRGDRVSDAELGERLLHTIIGQGVTVGEAYQDALAALSAYDALGVPIEGLSIDSEPMDVSPPDRAFPVEYPFPELPPLRSCGDLV